MTVCGIIGSTNFRRVVLASMRGKNALERLMMRSSSTLHAFPAVMMFRLPSSMYQHLLIPFRRPQEISFTPFICCVAYLLAGKDLDDGQKNLGKGSFLLLVASYHAVEKLSAVKVTCSMVGVSYLTLALR